MASKTYQQEEELRAHIQRREPLYVVHYACGDIEAKVSPPVTCVVVQNYESGEVRTFRSESEEGGSEGEKNLLRQAFAFFSENPNAKFLHWKMRDAEFGFRHLAQRLGEDAASSIPGRGRLLGLHKR